MGVVLSAYLSVLFFSVLCKILTFSIQKSVICKKHTAFNKS